MMKKYEIIRGVELIRIALFTIYLALISTLISAQQNPSSQGPFPVKRHFYEPASPETSDPLRTDISKYLTTPDKQVEEKMDRVPLRGVGYFPEGSGPFPLVLLVHGNHPPLIPSHEGYDYLQRLLASYGMICISIDNTFLNGAVLDSLNARAIVLLRHLQRWREWNDTPGHLFYKKVHLDRIGLAGHSVGGEAINIAYLLNSSLHDDGDPEYNFNFAIRSLFAMAPTDFQKMPVVLKNTSHFVMQGSHDGDVKEFDGQKIYDRAMLTGYPGDHFKSLVFIHGANHNSWNTIWIKTFNDTEAGGIDSPLRQITAQQQQSLAKIFASAFFQLTLLGIDYKELLTGEVSFSPKKIILIQQYQHMQSIDLNNYEEDNDPVTGSYPGSSNTFNGLAPLIDSRIEGNFTHNDTNGLTIGWSAPTSVYEINLPKIEGSIDDYPFLSLRVGQIYEESNVFNRAGKTLDFSISLELGTTTTHSLRISQFARLPYPVKVTILHIAENSKSVMKTVRIPIQSFDPNNSDWNLQDISKIKILFDRSRSGLIVIDDIQFSK